MVLSRLADEYQVEADELLLCYREADPSAVAAKREQILSFFATPDRGNLGNVHPRREGVVR